MEKNARSPFCHPVQPQKSPSTFGGAHLKDSGRNVYLPTGFSTVSEPLSLALPPEQQDVPHAYAAVNPRVAIATVIIRNFFIVIIQMIVNIDSNTPDIFLGQSIPEFLQKIRYSQEQKEKQWSGKHISRPANIH